MICIWFWILILCGQLNIYDYGSVADYASNSYKLSMVMAQYEYYRDVGPEDEFKSPIRTCKEGGGDCDDFAMLVYETLALYDYEVVIYALGNETRAHAICYYKKGKDEGYFSNMGRVKCKNFNIWDYRDQEGYNSILIIKAFNHISEEQYL